MSESQLNSEIQNAFGAIQGIQGDSVTGSPPPTSPIAQIGAPHRNSVGRRFQSQASIASLPLSPQALLLSLRRRWQQAVTIGVPFMILAALLAWLLLPAHYTAFALLRVASTEPRLVFETAETGADFNTYRRTQVALMKSRFVLNAALRKKGLSDLSIVRQQQFPLQWLESAIKVDSYDSPEILRISMTGDHPEELSAIVNAVKDAFLEEVVHAERKERVARLNDLERIFEQTEEKVRRKEERISSLAKQLGTGDVEALTVKQQMALEYFAELRREHSRVRFELMRLQVHDSASSDIAGLLLQSENVGAPDPTVDDESNSEKESGDTSTDDRVRIGLAHRRIVQLKILIERYEDKVADPNHPTLVTYRKELTDLQEMAGDVDETGVIVSSSSRGHIDLLKRQERLLSEELDKYSELVKNIGTSSFELEQMKSEIGQIEKVSNRVGGEMEALRIELQSPTRVTLLQEADVPKTRDMGRKRNLTAAAGVGSLGMIFLIVATVEFHIRRITRPEDVSESIGQDLLGTMPAKPQSTLRFWQQSHSARMTLWNNALIESVDSIRSILFHASDEDRRRVLMIASANSGEGKTTFACQLAGSLARAGRKTILVDCDLRRPRAHQLLDVPLELGMSELLSEGLDVATVIHETNQPNLSVIPAGHMNDMALHQFARDGAASVFETLRQDYEYVIVDSSPILYVADGGAIGKNMDGAILVVRSGVSRLPVSTVACERLNMLNLDLLGAVMVDVRANLGGYGYAYNYQYSSGVTV